jgi:glyceraldehyde-3-phosphate dehydrogenase/erythrose-4-phosphate dehydrogenase
MAEPFEAVATRLQLGSRDLANISGEKPPAHLSSQLRFAVEQANTYLRDCALSPELQEQIDYSSSTEIVSSDLVGSRHAGVVDAPATIANGRNVVLYVWYDNEFGYSCQVVRLAQQMAGIQFASFPA